MLLLEEYRKIYYNKKDTGEKETEKIITKTEHFTENILFIKWLRQLDNYSGSITGEFGASLTDLQRLDTVT